ncbi:MAG: methylhydantoinase [Rhodospirillaceae bacterium]|nr:methylhydantoinase [Rhodospirillaceae bacterium]
MSYRLGVDIGGTFTDFALFDEAKGEMCIHKQLTTPDDPSRAVLEGTARLLERKGVDFAEVETIAHGTTLVTNAVIERRGAVTGMLVTEGFRDVPDMARETRYDLFDLRLAYPEPLVPRQLRREMAERVKFDGSVETAPDEAAIRAAIGELVEKGIKALAICFLHSYTNPAHERLAREVAERDFPDLYVSTSADIFSNMREFERWTTAAVNAYTQPLFDSYLQRLEGGLQAAGFGGRLLVMTSSGGMLAPEAARRYPVRALESGPAAGALMSAYHGQALDIPDLLSFDMGGTTAKGALVNGFQPLKQYDMEVARLHDFKRGSGLPVKVPVIDMVEIGSGGGSLAEVDERGLIRVGPRSAGADPGPACYGKGGTRAALTDANLLLGYLDADYFLGGDMKLDRDAARAAIEADVAKPLGVTVERAAWGMHEIINEDVARAFRIHASERGFDYRGASMVAFGGSGPAHAMAVARKLKIPRVVFPAGAGVMSAFGLLVSPLAFELSRSEPCTLAELDGAGFAERFQAMAAEASELLLAAGVVQEDIRLSRRLDMRYQGQGYEIEVALPEDGAFDDLPALFRETYAQTFSTSMLDEPLEIVTWKVEAVGPEAALTDGFRLEGATQAGEARKGSRQAYFGDGYVDCPVHERGLLAPGAEVTGPAMIEERESTCVIGPGDRVRVDERRNLIAELGES